MVEDEDFVREVTCQVLQFEGYEVLRARSAAEAMRVFHDCGKSVQLLLTDMVLPGRNGRALARDLASFCPGLKTLFVSGYPEVEIARSVGAECGVYLAKPFSVESLMRAVKGALEDSAAGLNRDSSHPRGR